MCLFSNNCTIINYIINDYKINYKNINFETNFKDKIFNLNIDKSQISRVFQNLIINSIHSINEKDIIIDIPKKIKNKCFVKK